MPSQLSIATSALQRLIKEERSYHEEMKAQQARIQKLEAGGGTAEEDEEDGNREFTLRQERKALEESKAVLPTLQEKITAATEKLESLLPSGVEGVGADEDAELIKARETVRQAKEVRVEVSEEEEMK